MSDATFTFMVRSLSAWDAVDLINDNPTVEYQLGKLYAATPGHEAEFRLKDFSPGEPTSPVIEGVDVSISNFYVHFFFKDSAMYLILPAMSTIELGWLEKYDG